ncbi:MAG: iron ABC transporter permease [Candidatus Omnitrophica bacterium]|nr:iron ABC transporter permease [Candidatus Omnitrophota bacterium]
MKRRYLFIVAVLILVFLICIAINLGSIKIPLYEIAEGFLGKQSERFIIVRDLRLPRILIAVFVGANLAVSGVLLQAVMQNPLVDPGITGVSSGASVIAILVMLYLPQFYNILPFASFLGGLFACFLVYSLAWKRGLSPIRIVLSGVAVNAFLGGISSILAILNTDKIAGVLMWINGSMASRGWKDVKVLSVYSIFGLIFSLFLYKSCNILSLGEKNAKNLGTNINLNRLILSLTAVFLAGVSTSIVGIIGFVGLIVPHIARMLIGSNHKFLIPFSMLSGSITLLLADTLARTIAKPYEIPVGVVMAALGGPFFLYLLRRSDKR